MRPTSLVPLPPRQRDHGSRSSLPLCRLPDEEGRQALQQRAANPLIPDKDVTPHSSRDGRPSLKTHVAPIRLVLSHACCFGSISPSHQARTVRRSATMMAERILLLPKSTYTFYKPLGDGLYLVRRAGDGELLLARPLDVDGEDAEASRLRELVRHGGALAAANLLNHPNLVSIYDEMVQVPAAAAALPPSGPSREDDNNDSDSSGESRHGNTAIQAVATSIQPPASALPVRFLLWDYADLGTLQGVLDDYYPPRKPGRPAGDKIPESFIWHVALSLLSALQYLHHGRRDVRRARPQTPDEAAWDRAELAVALGPDAAASGALLRRFVRVRHEDAAAAAAAGGEERDWWPVLHRDVTAQNVFLQRPRGTETYGAVKLGGLGRCFVASAAVGGFKKTPIVAPDPEGREEDVSAAVLRERLARWKRDGLATDRAERPYTQGSDLFAVGKLVYHMMFGAELPPAEECPGCGCVHVRTDKTNRNLAPCPHGCVGDVDVQDIQKATGYSVPLRLLAQMLLRRNRDDGVHAAQVLDAAWPGYLSWVSRTADGRLYRDEYDDMWLRQQNKTRLDKQMQEEDPREPTQLDVTPSAVF
ncbi:hypothetical protein VTJ83DRAFT_5419 [Remersonia thermophila]|uniref:non-specific serine/threonine protein kinase n=1 Tax=Remersonia thermophila TaxID=72144 RepID=A0ABR4D708_9PEZI